LLIAEIAAVEVYVRFLTDHAVNLCLPHILSYKILFMDFSQKRMMALGFTQTLVVFSVGWEEW